MKHFFIVPFSLIMSALLLSYRPVVASADQAYSNADLQKYAAGSNGVIIPEKPAVSPEPVKKQKQAKQKDEEKSKKYWCDKGSAQRAKIDKARARVEDAEQELAELDPSPKNRKQRAAAEKKVRSAKKGLYRTEQALDDLEQKAHKQGIPPGWIRCQYDY